MFWNKKEKEAVEIKAISAIKINTNESDIDNKNLKRLNEQLNDKELEFLIRRILWRNY